jgi:hypothetical protein
MSVIFPRFALPLCKTGIPEVAPADHRADQTVPEQQVTVVAIFGWLHHPFAAVGEDEIPDPARAVHAAEPFRSPG